MYTVKKTSEFGQYGIYDAKGKSIGVYYVDKAEAEAHAKRLAGDSKMTEYMIVTQTAFGQVFLRQSESLSGRFVVEKCQAALFTDIGPAKEWLAQQEDTMNATIFRKCKIIEAF